jgi:hypothetical protein
MNSPLQGVYAAFPYLVCQLLRCSLPPSLKTVRMAKVHVRMKSTRRKRDKVLFSVCLISIWISILVRLLKAMEDADGGVGVVYPPYLPYFSC